MLSVSQFTRYLQVIPLLLACGTANGIEQSVLTLRAATYAATAATHTADETRLRLLSSVKSLWWLVFYLNRPLEIVENNHNLLQQFVDITRSKYEVGEGLQQDVLLAQLELPKLLEQKISLTGMRKNSAAKLNAWLYQLAENARPLLAGERQGMYAAESRPDLAKKDILPDFNVEAALRHQRRYARRHTALRFIKPRRKHECTDFYRQQTKQSRGPAHQRAAAGKILIAGPIEQSTGANRAGRGRGLYL